MNTRVITLFNQLAKKCLNLKPPVHVIAICFGGQMVGKYIAKYLKEHGIAVTYDEVWTNVVKKKASIWKTTFRKQDYKGTALITEDVIWKGTLMGATKKMLRKMKKKKVYTAVLLDLRHKADFSIFK